MIFAGLDKRVILGGLIIVLLVVVNLASSGPPSGVNDLNLQDATATQEALITQEVMDTRTPLPTEPSRTEPPAGMQLATPTPTPLPFELQANFQQTNGIIIVAGILVLIVAAGVFNQLISERRAKH